MNSVKLNNEENSAAEINCQDIEHILNDPAYMEKENLKSSSSHSIKNAFYTKAIQQIISYFDEMNNGRHYTYEFVIDHKGLDFLTAQWDSVTKVILKKLPSGKNLHELVLKNIKIVQDNKREYEESTINQQYLIEEKSEIIQHQCFREKFLKLRRTDNSYVDYLNTALLTKDDILNNKGMNEQIKKQAAVLLNTCLINLI